jgi:hypothetical protein
MKKLRVIREYEVVIPEPKVDRDQFEDLVANLRDVEGDPWEVLGSPDRLAVFLTYLADGGDRILSDDPLERGTWVGAVVIQDDLTYDPNVYELGLTEYECEVCGAIEDRENLETRKIEGTDIDILLCKSCVT